MPQDRPAVPAQLKREVLTEAGHRCAIPTCRSVPIEIAHIIPWADVREHAFDNLIALCPTCHTRFDTGTIDRQSMRMYKQNLATTNGRYGDVERRVLTYFALNPNVDEVQLPGVMDILMMHLLHDGYVIYGETFRASATYDGLFDFNVPVLQIYRLTEEGREFVQRLSDAEEAV
ncbi:HNH endonuclease [Actinokineospora sp. PR83]|uniref:HNH endonuclease signature motif containing protein n=1 Tax=Actinokineospora sp. PR83 TaxID=2884908 RepID=UPI001F22AF38|nr:HNH endonuclease signature motif containing protein [Actinokineospora sp. PR83]MCG8914896.1 HNH endonuclease [Actinokineospora sp. PR83]